MGPAGGPPGYNALNQQAAAASFARQLLQHPPPAGGLTTGTPFPHTAAPTAQWGSAQPVPPPSGLPAGGIYDTNHAQTGHPPAQPQSGYGPGGAYNSHGGSVPPRGSQPSGHHVQKVAIGGDPGRVIRNASDASFNERKIFIGGLGYDTTNEMLKEFFEQKYGTVDSAEIMRDRTTNISRGFGFVIFADHENVDRAVMDSPFECYGTKVDIRRAQPKSERMADGHGVAANGSNEFRGGRGGGGGPVHSKESLVGKVFVGGLDFEVKEANINKYFSQFGAIKSIEMMENRATGQPRGFCFLTFEDPEVAKSCTGRHPELSRSCEVKLAVPRPHKGQQLQNGQDGGSVGTSGPYGQKPQGGPRGGHMGMMMGQSPPGVGPYGMGSSGDMGFGGPSGRGYGGMMGPGSMGHGDGMKQGYHMPPSPAEPLPPQQILPEPPKILQRKFTGGVVYRPSNPPPVIKTVFGPYRPRDTISR